MTRVTLKDVAARAGVSHQTVSNVLNGHPSIRPATRDRVLAAVQALDYQPNQAAKALREARVTSLCCAFFGHDPQDIADPYHNTIQAAFVAEANARGYSMTTAFFGRRDPQSWETLRQRYLQGLFGGLVLVGVTLTSEQLETIQSWGVKTVLCDHSLPDLNTPSSSADYAGGMARLVAHHVTRGRRNLALILPEDDPGSTARQRLQGFRQATREAGVEAAVVSRGWSFEVGEAAMRELWSGTGRVMGRPDAVLAANDRMAAGALRAAHALGLRVPEDVAISGFDDFEFTRYTTPSLTTAHVPHGEMTRQAVRDLLSHLETGEAPPPRVFPVLPVIRESA